MHKEEAESTKDSIVHNNKQLSTSPQLFLTGVNIRHRQRDLVPGPTPHVLTFCLLHSLHTHLFIRNSWSLLSLGALHAHAEVGRGSLIGVDHLEKGLLMCNQSGLVEGAAEGL